ncbi:MAG: alpha-L-fucosidase [Pirellulales bacterium]|nr:alpha-L-fucosidase [Pirellulales bacterium]
MTNRTPDRIICTLAVVLIVAFALTAALPAFSDTSKAASQAGPAVDADVARGLKASPEDVARWRKLKFGLFIHWGPVSLQGTEIGWSRGGLRRGHSSKSNPDGVPVEVYDNLYKKFNPVKFDAKEWVDTAKAAGMKYMVFTTKHHDGFANFDSKLTDYKITSPECPFGRDIVRQLADACHENDFIWGVYYSQPDWHHPDYRTENHARYIKYLHGQMRDLLTNYGKVEMIFFDGLGGKAVDWDAQTLIPMCRKLQPGIMINNRCGLPADFDTPEQRIGRMQTDRPWETCMTLCHQWAWKPGDEMKSLKQCLQTLVRVVGGDGNLLFNVGPMPDGRIEPRQVERLKEMGEWLKKYGESIYDTRGGPFRVRARSASTYRGKTIYVHLLDPKSDTVTLPPINRKIVSHRVLTGGTAEVKQTDESITIAVPQADRDPIDTIVALELDGPASGVTLGTLYSESVALDKKARASNVFRNYDRGYGPAMAFDDNPKSRWATDEKVKQAWIEVDLGEPVAIDRVHLIEAVGSRVKKFKLLAQVDGRRETIHEGTTIGPDRTITFKPVTAQSVCLHILESDPGPTIAEFEVFRPKKRSKN